MEGICVRTLIVSTFDDVDLPWWRFSEEMKRLKQGYVPPFGQPGPKDQ